MASEGYPVTGGRRNAWLGAALLLSLITALFGARSGVQTDTADLEASNEASQPNILLLVADDLGYNDTSAINSGGAATPALEQLARDGVLFTRHYADSTCTPSRVALLTGRQPQRMGFRPTGMEIPPEYMTLPEALAGLGYRTHLVGKWHAGEQRADSLPLAQGFHSFFGFHNQWQLAGEITDNNRGRFLPGYQDPWLRTDDAPPQQYHGHLTDILLQQSLQRIAAGADSDEPWFIYHGFYAPHAPIQPAARFAREQADTPEGRYLALVAQLDDAVAQLLEALTTSGQAQDTLVIFLSDNGGTNADRDNNYPFYGAKNETYEGAFRTPLMLRWPSQLPAGMRVTDVVMNTDIYPTVLDLIDAVTPESVDGRSLRPLFEGKSLPGRGRSWEQYTWASEALSLSHLSADGRFRLANLFGLTPILNDLDAEPAGHSDVAASHVAQVQQQLQAFWTEHWEMARVSVDEAREGTTAVYRGFDLQRVPYQSTFTIGLALGPLPDGTENAVLAEQPGSWSLVFSVDDGLVWRIGDAALRATDFDPGACNDVVLTGHFRPPALVRPVPGDNRVKFYVNGNLAQLRRSLSYALPVAAELSAPTVVHYGHAQFANVLVAKAGESYAPEVPQEHEALFRRMQVSGELAQSRLATMESGLCAAVGR